MKKNKKKFRVNIEGGEFKYLPTKKIELVAKREDGEFVISKFENLVKVKAKQIKKRNPDKTILFEVRNKLNEKIQFAHYKGNDFINVFVNGGVHNLRFVLNKQGLSNLVHSLNTCIITKDKELNK